jgi:hypothetical protein
LIAQKLPRKRRSAIFWVSHQEKSLKTALISEQENNRQNLKSAFSNRKNAGEGEIRTNLRVR